MSKPIVFFKAVQKSAYQVHELRRAFQLLLSLKPDFVGIMEEKPCSETSNAEMTV